MLRGKRTERYLRQMKGGERVAAVKISAAFMPLRNFGHRNRTLLGQRPKVTRAGARNIPSRQQSPAPPYTPLNSTLGTKGLTMSAQRSSWAFSGACSPDWITESLSVKH